MSSKTKTIISYKIVTAIGLLICGLNFICIYPYFSDEDYANDGVPTKVNSNTENFENDKRQMIVHPGNDNISDDHHNYISVNWPLTKSRSFFNDLFNNHKFWWISRRVQSLWPEFEHQSLRIGGRNCTGGRKNILILPGVLVFTEFASKESIKKGGPLGELTQWADLIAGALALCHNVDLQTNFNKAQRYLMSKVGKRSHRSGCAGDDVDLIFTDIIGIKKLPSELVALYKNKFRILDVFGTEAAFNDLEYANENNLTNERWGILNLNLKQFYTMFPHSPDNSFLGFVVSSSSFVDRPKQNYSLLLGKETKYLKGKMELLKTISEFFPLAATISSRYSSLMPEGSLLVGIVDPSEYTELLSEAKVCLGLGDPIESPSPLLSLAAGCMFLNPIKNQSLAGKPTNRKVTSQNVFLERYVKPPHVWSYDQNDLNRLKQILMKIKEIDYVEPIIPKPFTVFGFLERLQTSLLRRDFCSPSTNHIPPFKLRTFLAGDSDDCKNVCYARGLICEPDYFAQLNNLSFFKSSGLNCKKISTLRTLYTPAYDKVREHCYFQPITNPLFSCVGQSEQGLRRMCPCTRDLYGDLVTFKGYRKSKFKVTNVP